MGADPLLVALTVGEIRRVLRCHALDQAGFEVPNPGGLAPGDALRVQIRSDAGGRQGHTVDTRVGFLSEGRARFTFEGVPPSKVEALARMAARCGVYRGTKRLVHREATPVSATPFGAVDSVGERHLVELPPGALSRPEVRAQIRRGLVRLRHAPAPAPSTPVAVRLRRRDGRIQVLEGRVVGVEGDEFSVELCPRGAAFTDELDDPE